MSEFDFEDRARIEAMLEDMAINGEDAQRRTAEAVVLLEAEVERLGEIREAAERWVMSPPTLEAEQRLREVVLQQHAEDIDREHEKGRE